MSSGPSSLDSDASFILTSDERPAQITATKLPRATTNNHSADQPAIRTRDKHFWQTTDKYDYRNVNLTGSVSEKMGKRIMSADEYGWRHTTSVDRDGKEWQRTRRSSHHQNGKDLDWEYNVQQYENLGDRSGARLQYYEANDSPIELKKNSSATLDDKKEMKFPGLKTFKSASMRLPGQKSSMQEVQQLLRLKFNRINIGLRKRRALSVQEVFPPERSTSQSSALNGMPVRPPSQFYVPSPLAYKNNNNNYKDVDDEGPASLPFFINDAMKQSSQQHYTKDNLNNKHTVTISRASPDLNGRTQNNSDRINNSNDLGRDRVLETLPSSLMSSASVQTTQKSIIIAPQFVVGGCVSNGSKHTSAQHTSRLSDVSTATTTSLEKIRLRPRSHSPLKTADDKAKNRKKRESFGFFERINRMMHTGVQQLPPPHSSTASSRANNTKMNSASANNHNNKISTQANNNRNGNVDSGGTGAEYTYRRASSNKNVKNLTLASITALRPTTADAESNRTATKPDTLLLRDRKPNTQQVCRSLSNFTTCRFLDCYFYILCSS